MISHIPAPLNASAVVVPRRDGIVMVSRSQKTKRRRYNRDRDLGRARKRKAAQEGTPVFPLHPEGYDPNAADAKPQPSNDA